MCSNIVKLRTTIFQKNNETNDKLSRKIEF